MVNIRRISWVAAQDILSQGFSCPAKDSFGYSTLVYQEFHVYNCTKDDEQVWLFKMRETSVSLATEC